MQVDHSLDYQNWDNTVSVRYEEARAVPSVADVPPLFDGRAPAPAPARIRNRSCLIETAMRRNLTRRELATSGGVYTGDDQVFLLPEALFPQGWARSKPGDVVVEIGEDEESGTRWTVLDTNWMVNRTIRRLTCRDLVLSYALRDTITIERPALSYDAAGVAVKAFPSDASNPGGVVLYGSLPARAQLMSKEVAEAYGIQGLEGKYQVFVDREIDVTLEDRVLLASGLYLDIVGYQQAMRIDQLPFIVCERRV